MKLLQKNFIRTVLVVLLGLMTLQTSCKKDDSKESLNGTVWKGAVNEDDYSNEWTISFHESTFTLKAKIDISGDTSTGSIDGTYSYNPPRITLIIGGETINGTISGSQMTLFDADEEGNAMILIKQ